MDYATLLQLLDSTLRLGTPLLLACLAGLYSERAGIFDIGLEGKMLMAAMASASVAYLTGSVWMGVLAGIGASLILAGIHGIASITFRGNQLISGVALNFVASGITVLVAQRLFAQHPAVQQVGDDAAGEGDAEADALGRFDDPVGQNQCQPIWTQRLQQRRQRQQAQQQGHHNAGGKHPAVVAKAAHRCASGCGWVGCGCRPAAGTTVELAGGEPPSC